MVEVWKVIPKFHSYEVSDLGGVRNADTGEPLAVVVEDGRRRIVLVGDDGRRRNCSVASLVLAAFVGPPRAPRNRPVYVNGRTEDTLANLRYGTRAEQLARFAGSRAGSHAGGRPRSQVAANVAARVLRVVESKKSTLRAEARRLGIPRGTLADAVHRLRQR